MIRRIASLLVLALLVVGVQTVKAQVGSTATFTWNGGGPNTVTFTVEFATIDDTATNQAIAYAGGIQFIGYGTAISALELPRPGTCSIPRNPDGTCSGEEFPTFPNGGYISPCGMIAFGAKQWGTRPDGSKMDGTKAGDSYLLPGTANCAVEGGGAVAINITEFREMIAHTSCYRGCHTYLVDTMESGYGTAEVTQ